MDSWIGGGQTSRQMDGPRRRVSKLSGGIASGWQVLGERVLDRRVSGGRVSGERVRYKLVKNVIKL